MAHDVQENRYALTAIMLFLAIIVLIAFDLIVDFGEGASWGHLAVELVVLVIAAGGIALLWLQFAQTRSDLAEAQDAADKWRQENYELLQGFGVAIANQFTRWQLTKSEAEVGLLLLKGLSHKEISMVRNTSDRTIREQARAIYRKSGLSGRSSLSAFFLEDLLLPQVDDGVKQSTASRE